MRTSKNYFDMEEYRQFIIDEFRRRGYEPRYEEIFPSKEGDLHELNIYISNRDGEETKWLSLSSRDMDRDNIWREAMNTLMNTYQESCSL